MPLVVWSILTFTLKVPLRSNFYLVTFLGVLGRIPWKNENAVYWLQIPASVPEIINLENANEMTDDVIHSSEYNIPCIYRAILANLQRRLLKLSRLIVHQKLKSFLTRMGLRKLMPLTHSELRQYIKLKVSLAIAYSLILEE